MHEHTQMVEEVYRALRKVGRSEVPTIAGFGPRGPEATAENCSELELTSASGQEYVLSIIEKE
jgi:hypothetical protein